MIPTTANAAELQALREALAAIPVGEICTYEILDAALGASSRARRYLVIHALDQLNKETGAIFGSVRTVGYKRLPADEAHTLGSAARRRMRKSARKTSATIARAVNAANDIAPEAKRRATAEVSTLNMIAHVAADRVTKVAEMAIKPLTLAESLAGVLDHLGRPSGPAA